MPRALKALLPPLWLICWVNLTGQPAISPPLYWTADGLPMGVQLVARAGREDLLLQVASQFEPALPWSDRHPAVNAVG